MKGMVESRRTVVKVQRKGSALLTVPRVDATLASQCGAEGTGSPLKRKSRM